MGAVSQTVDAVQGHDLRSADDLLPLVYDELRRLAASKLANEKPGQTLNATALVHEAYLRLVKHPQAGQWIGHRHFFAAAAEAMRRIILDNVRRKRSQKRGRDRSRIQLDESALTSRALKEDVLEVDEALTRLTAADPEAAELVKLRYFAGLSISESAAVLGISTRSADRLWAYARAYLRDAVRDA